MEPEPEPKTPEPEPETPEPEPEIVKSVMGRIKDDLDLCDFPYEAIVPNYSKFDYSMCLRNANSDAAYLTEVKPCAVGADRENCRLVKKTKMCM